MSYLNKCKNTIITRWDFLISSFNQAFGISQQDTNGNFTFSYEETVVKAMPLKGSAYKENTTYVRGDILSFKGYVYISKRTSRGQNPEDDFYFLKIEKEVLFNGVGKNIYAYVNATCNGGGPIDNQVQATINGNSYNVDYVEAYGNDVNILSVDAHYINGFPVDGSATSILLVQRDMEYNISTNVYDYTYNVMYGNINAMRFSSGANSYKIKPDKNVGMISIQVK